jgi:hypothetical protein
MGGARSAADEVRSSYRSAGHAGRESAAALGVQRIRTMVGSQLEAAGMPLPRQWRAYRTFVFGYIDALADLHACNGGKRAQGPESRAMSASVLAALCGDAQANAQALTDEFEEVADADANPDPGAIGNASARDEFRCGQSAALNDYAQWSEKAMSGIEAFIDAATEALLRLEPQPEIEPAAHPGAELTRHDALLG